MYRSRGEPHPLMQTFGVEAVPFQHHSLEDWRDNRKGIQFQDKASHFLFFGAIDDIWVNADGELHVVDYKSTSISGTVTLEGEWKEAYKRQVEMYQWLFRQNGFPVSSTAFFVYVNGDKSKAGFDGRLEFSMQILPHDGDDSWVAEALQEARLCLERDTLPPSHPDCEWCSYRRVAKEVEG